MFLSFFNIVFRAAMIHEFLNYYDNQTSSFCKLHFLKCQDLHFLLARLKENKDLGDFF